MSMGPLLVLVATAICCNHNSLAERTEAVERTAYLMGTTLRLVVTADNRPTGIAATEMAFAEVRRLEGVLSSWTPASEVGRLNALPGGAQAAVSPELWQLLSRADRWVRATGHAFDPGIGALIDAWGFRTTPAVPSADQLHSALDATGWSHLALLDHNRVRRGPNGWWIDTGGFGKGAALDAAAAILRGNGVREAVLDFGGQVSVLGRTERIAVADPRNREQPIKWIRVRDVSVATSSQSERYIEADGHRYGHILDPHTGQPVPAWGSVTVVSADALTADALSTALFVMGPQAALQWSQAHPEVDVLVLESQATGVRATWSRGMLRWITQEK